MSKDKAKILDKVMKLLALSKSDNPNEAASALRKAQALMQMHGISNEDIDLSLVHQVAVMMDRQKPLKHDALLINTIAKAFGVKPLVDYGLDQNFNVRAKIQFIGFEHQPVLAAYCFDVLNRQMKLSRKKFIATLSNRCKPATKTKRADTFCFGWVATISSKVIKFAMTDEQSALIDRFVQKNHRSVEKTKAKARKGSTANQHSDFYAGSKAAKDVDIHRPIHGQEVVKLTHQKESQHETA